MTLPDRLLTAVKKAQDTILICPPVISQEAACGALEAGRAFCEVQIAALARVRESVFQELATVAPVVSERPRSQGAFYVLLDVRSSMNPLDFVERLVREHRVGVLPGSTFGLDRGCTLRLAYGALDGDTVRDGVGRLCRGIRALAEEG